MSSWNPVGQELVGKIVERLYVDSVAQHSLVFLLEDGTTHMFEAQGDCCSESWFYHVLGVDALLGCEIVSVEEIDFEGWATDGISRQECDQIYGIKIMTKIGWCDIEFRNSSNGYYGGWITESKEDVQLAIGFEEIYDDWTYGVKNGWFTGE